VIGNPIEFSSHTPAGWRPTSSFDEAITDICQWAATSNYAIKRD
jgi:hypothetical protein